MQVLDSNDLEATPVEGVNGPLSVFHAIRDPTYAVQLVVVPPMTKAPKMGNPLREKMVIFVIAGAATFTNGEYYEKVSPGKLIVLEPGEERVYQTEKEKLVAVEFKFAGKAKQLVPVEVAVPLPSPEAGPKKAAGEFFEA